jgi:signal transduction histidine kinase
VIARRRLFTFAKRVSGFGRLTIAIVLLALVWFATIKAVDRGTRTADQRRASDRAAVAAGFAGSIGTWLDAGRTEVVALGRQVGSLPKSGLRPVLQSYLSGQRTFTRNVLVFQGSTVMGATGRLELFTDSQPASCTRTDEKGASVRDDGLTQLLTRTRSTRDPVTSQIFDVPGSCEPAIATAVLSGQYVVVSLGNLADATARLEGGSLIADQTSGGDRGTRVYFISGPLALEPRLGIVSTPASASTFIASASKGGDRVSRYSAGTADVLAAYAPVSGGGAVVLEQDAAVFDIELQNRPSILVASTLTIVFAIVFALLALFDIRRARERRRAEAAKNAFFSIAGHELRTPLTVLSGFADTLSAHWDQLAERNRRALVDRMTPQTRRLERLVQRLLVAASIQAETHTRPVMRGVQVFPVLVEVVERFAPEAPLHEFILRKDGLELVAEADPEALATVVDHLIDNAVKYSPSGGRVWVRAVERDKTIEVVVEDEGIGLPSDHSRIFDQFVQGESVTKRVHDEGGVGLGLFIARTLVRDMRGSIRAEPREGSGSRFVVSLARSRTSAPLAPSTSGVAMRDDRGLVRNQGSRTRG